MSQTTIVFSLAIAVILSGVVSFVAGFRRYNKRKRTRGVDPDDRTLYFILYGSMASVLFGDVLLSTQSRSLLLMPLLCGIGPFLLGEWTLHKYVIAGKAYYFSLSMSIAGATLSLLSFPLLVNITGLLSWLYGAIVMAGVVLQFLLIELWKKKRMS